MLDGDVNHAPTIDSLYDQAIVAGQTLTFGGSATDPDGDSLTYSLDGAPDGASIDASGQGTWTSSETLTPGNYGITIRVTDSGEPALSDEKSFTVVVSAPNHAPTLGSISNSSIGGGDTISFTAGATDVDGQTLVYSLDAGAPDGASIDGATGAFTWTAAETLTPGNYGFTVRVTDTGVVHLSDARSFTVTVSAPNQAPTFAEFSDVSIVAGDSISFTASATDPEGQTLTYSLGEGAPAGASIDASTGAFSWATSADLPAGTYSVTIRATDSGAPARTGAQSFSVVVSAVNQAPTLRDLSDASVVAGDTISFTAAATDPEGQSITYSLEDGAPAGASIDASTGAFSWATSVNLTPGIYAIAIRATDNGQPQKSDTKSFNVIVTAANTAPTTGGLADLTVDEDAADTVIGLQSSFSDAEDSPSELAYGVESNSNSDLVSAWIDASTGALTLNYAAHSHGTSQITVRATDTGGLSVATTFTVTVNHVNHAPVISGFSGAPQYGDYWTFSGSVSDVDDDIVGCNVTIGGQFGLTATVDSNGTFSVTAQCCGMQCGEFSAQTQDSSGLASNSAVYYVYV